MLWMLYMVILHDIALVIKARSRWTQLFSHWHRWHTNNSYLSCNTNRQFFYMANGLS